MRYVLLLRGVNVGGNHRVPKGEFQQVLEDNGCSNVTIYLNSGNAVFTSDEHMNVDKLQHALETHFGFAIPSLLLTGEYIKAIAAQIPESWTNDSLRSDKSGQKSDVLYLFKDADTPDILQKLGHNPEIERMVYTSGAVLANITRANQSRGSLQKIVGTKIYDQVTIRNVNTTRKLAELV